MYEAVKGAADGQTLLAPLVNPTPYTLHLTPHTLHPAPYTLHPTPYTLHPAPYTPCPTACTLHPTPYTLSAERASYLLKTHQSESTLLR